MSNRALLFVAPVLGLLCLTTSSRAGLITWTADWSQSSNVANSNGGPETGGISIASPPANVVQTGSQTTTAATLSTFTSAQAGSLLGPDLFNAVPYTLKVDLADLTSNKASMLTFTGSITGSLTTTTSSFNNTFNSPLTQTVQIGANDYTVTLTSFGAPGPSNPADGSAPVQGYIKATINVQAVDVSKGTSPLATPEPTSLVLAGLGTSLVGLLRFRRTTRVAAAN